MRSNIFWSFEKTEGARSPIELQGRPGLAIVPYVRGRLSFAQIAVAAIEAGRFNRVVVDLPRFLTRGELIELAHSAFPLAFTMIVRKGPGRHLLLPFVPNDAGCIATFSARRKRIGYECIDSENLVFHSEGTIFSPDLTPPDDFFALSKGLDGYFAPLWSRMDAMWEQAPPVTKAFTAARASLVAARLAEAHASGGRTLFVCEYRLWWAIRRAFESEIKGDTPSCATPREELGLAFLAEDPYRLWIMGLLDDYPCVNLKFFEAVKNGNARSFDKLEALGTTLQELIEKTDPCVANGRSLTRFLAFRRYLWARIIGSGRVVPLPSAHLLDAAESCFGKEFARELAGTLLSYPVPDNQCGKNGSGFYSLTPDGTLKGGAAFELPDILETGDSFGTVFRGGGIGLPGVEDSDRDRWADIARRSLTRAEEKSLNGTCIGVTWAVKDDYILHQGACGLVRENIARDARRAVVKRSWGGMGDGIQWKATIRARAMEEKALYVRKRRSELRSLSIDAYTPHVFLFSDRIDDCAFSVIHDANLSQRNIHLGNDMFPFEQHPAPDHVYSLFKAVGRIESSLNGHIRREWNEALAFLYTRSHMGVERYDAITRKHARYQCRQTPFEDPELADFSHAEKFVAWSVKYAERAAVVVAYRGWSLSEKLAPYARDKNVKVIIVPLETLSPSLVRRLRTTHFISTALKKHPSREKLLQRFVA
jgi:hypothetical protein